MKFFKELSKSYPKSVVILRWKGHPEKTLIGPGKSHFSNFYVEFDVACASRTSDGSPKLVGYEVKWMDGEDPPDLYKAEGQAEWLLDQDASYAYVVRPPPREDGKRKGDTVGLLDHFRCLLRSR